MKHLHFVHFANLYDLRLAEVLPFLIDPAVPKPQGLIVTGCTRTGSEKECIEAHQFLNHLMNMLDLTSSQVLLVPGPQDVSQNYFSTRLFEPIKGFPFRCSEVQTLFLPPGLQLMSVCDQANGLPGVNDALFFYQEGCAEEYLSELALHPNFTRIMVHYYPLECWLRMPLLVPAIQRGLRVSLSHEEPEQIRNSGLLMLGERGRSFSLYQFIVGIPRLIRTPIIQTAEGWLRSGSIEFPFCAEAALPVGLNSSPGGPFLPQQAD